MPKGLVGSGLFVRDCIWPGCMVVEYYGEQMSHSEAAKLTTECAMSGIHKEYQLSIAGSHIIIVAMGHAGDAKCANHWCAPNARCNTIRLRGSEVAVVFI